MLLSARDDLFQKLEEYGWAIDGSTANALHIGKFPVDLRLEARLIVLNLGNNLRKIPVLRPNEVRMQWGC